MRQDHLNYDVKKFKFHGPDLVHQDSNWKLFEVMGDRFFWPSEYDSRGLKGLYREVYAPAEINPHAYETNRIRISEGDWVVDAGACEGFFTRYALQRKANVLAIEPISRLAEALETTFKTEIHEGRVKVLKAGISDASGVSQLKINSQEIYCSFVESGHGEDTPIFSLDDIVNMNIVPTINFLKMDIEGGEIDAIRGATKILKEIHPKVSIAVYHSYRNAIIIKNFIKNSQPNYHIAFRGLFIRDDFGPPRPYMLHAW